MSVRVDFNVIEVASKDCILSSNHALGKEVYSVMNELDLVRGYEPTLIDVPTFLKVDFYKYAPYLQVRNRTIEGDTVIQVHTNSIEDLYAENLLTDVQTGLRVLIDDEEYNDYKLEVEFR